MGDQWGAGDRANWHNHGLVTVGSKRYPLIYGEHPHSRQDNQHYVEMGGDEPTGFDGHRILIGVNLQSSNYLKESYLSGDQVRKGGSCEILADGEVVYEFFHRDPQWALIRAHGLIGELGEHPSGWLIKEEREKLVGRKVFYREIPAIIESLIVGQGCLMIRTESGEPFPLPVYRDDDDGNDDGEATVKAEVTDSNIWWFRK